MQLCECMHQITKHFIYVAFLFLKKQCRRTLIFTWDILPYISPVISRTVMTHIGGCWKYLGVIISENLTCNILKTLLLRVTRHQVLSSWISANVHPKWSLLPIVYNHVRPRLQCSSVLYNLGSSPDKWRPHPSWNKFSEKLPDSHIGIIPSLPQDVWQTWFRALGGSPSSNDLTWTGYQCSSRSSKD